MAVRLSLCPNAVRERPLTALAALLLAGLLPAYVWLLAHTFHIDFVAFWCAGSGVLQGRDPYLDATMHACEVSNGLLPTLTMPAPYAPYVMPIFALTALMKESTAFVVWAAVLILSTGLTARALAAVTGLSAVVTGAATALLVLIPALLLGQIVPLVIAAFALALWCAHRGNLTAAAWALALVGILPNFALPVGVAAFVCIPRMRIRLIVAGVALVAVGTLVTGWPSFVRYVSSVLPAHGRSEILAFWQLGAPGTLALGGVPISAAMAAGYAIYVAATVLGIVIGVRLRGRFGGDWWILATAAAFAAAGSPFVHGLDIGFAMPLTLLLLAFAPSPLTAAAAIAVLVPWQYLTQDTGVAVAITVPFLLIVIEAAFGPKLTPAALVTAAILLVALVGYRISGAPDIQQAAASGVPLHMALPADALAETRWRLFADATHQTPASLISRVPTYCALVLLSIAALVESKRARPLEKPAVASTIV